MPVDKWSTPRSVSARISRDRGKLFVETVGRHVDTLGEQDFLPASLDDIKAETTYQITKPGLSDKAIRSNFQSVMEWSAAWREVAKHQEGEVVFQDRSFRTIGVQSFAHKISFRTARDLFAFGCELRRAEAGFQRMMTLLTIDRRLAALISGWETFVNLNSADFQIVQEFSRTFSADKGAFEGHHIREVPIMGMDTKFIGRNKALLAQILTALGRAVHEEADSFEAKFGFRVDDDNLIRMRDLDGSILPFPELALPVTGLDGLVKRPDKVVIVENQATFNSLAPVSGVVAIFGGGGKISSRKLGCVEWLQAARILYMGDLDRNGLIILNSFRSLGFNVTSALMDVDTYRKYADYRIIDDGTEIRSTKKLSDREMALLKVLKETGQRLEQERIAHDEITAAITAFSAQS